MMICPNCGGQSLTLWRNPCASCGWCEADAKQAMICPNCGSVATYRPIYNGEYGPWSCWHCCWYEGHEADAKIDAERDADKQAHDDLASSGSIVDAP